MKSKLSVLLVLALLLTALPLSSVLASSDLEGSVMTSNDSLNGMVLVDTDTITIQDNEGNNFDVVVEEYEKLTKKPAKAVGDISPLSLYKEHPIGTKKTWVFKISNAQLGVAGIATGVPLSSAAKKKLTDAIVKLIGQKIPSAAVPLLGWTSWVATSAGIVNAAVGNNGFKASISGVYTSTYYNSGGYYVYNWKLNKPQVGTY